MSNSEENNLKKGFIKFYHSMLKWEWYDDANTFRVFVHCLLRANIKTEKWHGVELVRGQFATGRLQLAHELKLSEQQIRTSLKKLQITNEITIKACAKYSIITVNKYNFYNPDNQQITNKQPTDNQQNNQQITTNKEIKNNTNINKSIISVLSEKNKTTPTEKKFLKPTLEEVKKYISEKNLTVDPERFFYYYEANGWTQGNKKMKSWQAAVQYWQRTEKKEQQETESWAEYVDRVLGGNKNNGNE